jgi:hypothetical protein
MVKGKKHWAGWPPGAGVLLASLFWYAGRQGTGLNETKEKALRKHLVNLVWEQEACVRVRVVDHSVLCAFLYCMANS